MKKRIDALGDDFSPNTSLVSGLLDNDLDEELQSIVTEAATIAEAPISLASLMLKRIQFFKAYTGIPKDLATAQATDRDVSFCQFVVRDGAPFEVLDAERDDRVPQDLVQRFGIRAYLGIPVRIKQKVIGSLCVIDVRTRSFSEQQRAALSALAERASRRCEELANEGTHVSDRLLKQSMPPVFSAMRSLLAPIAIGLDNAIISAAELKPLARLSENPDEDSIHRALGSLSQARLALADLQLDLAKASSALNQLREVIEALEKASVGHSMRTLMSDVVHASQRISSHLTKPIGGVRWQGPQDRVSLHVSRSLAILALSNVLNACAKRLANDRCSGGINLMPATVNDRVTLRISCPELSEPALAELTMQLHPQMPREVQLDFEADDDPAIAITFPARPQAAQRRAPSN